MRAFCLAFLLLALGARAFCATLPYDENADARQNIREALNAADSTHRNVLLIFGANWCPACRQLDQSMQEGKTPVDENRYITVKIDVGRFDRNLDLAHIYGYPIRKGIPAASVVTPDRRVIYSGSLENFLMPYRRLAKIAVAAAGLFAVMLIVWEAITKWRRRPS